MRSRLTLRELRPVLVILTIVVVAAAGVLAVAGAARPGRPAGPMTVGGALPLGAVAEVDPSGAVARVHTVEESVEVAGSQPLEPGHHLRRLDVELCAGEEHWTVDPAFWLGLGAGNATFSTHLGVRDLRGLTLSPHGCQRGGVHLVVPDGAQVEQVLLSDPEEGTLARWTPGDAVAPDGPLSTGVPEVAELGIPLVLPGGGTVSVDQIVQSDERVTVTGQLCAGPGPLVWTPRHWLASTEGNQLIPGGSAGAGASSVDAGTCAPVDVQMQVGPRGAAQVVFAHGGTFEAGRWATTQ